MKFPVSEADPTSPLLSPISLQSVSGEWTAAWPGCISREGYILLRARWNWGEDAQTSVAKLTMSVSQHHREWTATFAIHSAASRDLVLGFYTDGGPWTLSMSAVWLADGPATLIISPFELYLAVLDVDEVPTAFDFSSLTGVEPNVPLLIMNANHGGLMNRLVSLFSAIETGTRLGCRVGCWWSPSSHCAASLDDLFDLPASGVLTGVAQPVDADFEFYYNYLPGEPPITLAEGAPIRIVHSTSLLRTDSAPISRWDDMGEVFRRLKFSSPIRRKLKPFADMDFSKTIGFHIRRPYPNGAFADVEQAKFGLSEQTFVNLIEDLRAHCPQIERILLCTNDPAWEKRLAERFGEYLFCFEKQSVDNTTDPIAVQEALVDVALLARCPLLISQSMSSFALVASSIGRSRLFCLTPETTEDVYDLWRVDSGTHNDSQSVPRADFARVVQQMTEWSTQRVVPEAIT